MLKLLVECLLGGFEMVVAIQRGLEGIKIKLAEKGYHVVYYDEYPHPIDAYIYIGYSNDVGYSNANMHYSISNVSHSSSPRHPGVLQINAQYRSFHEINRLLSVHKSYSYSIM